MKCRSKKVAHKKVSERKNDSSKKDIWGVDPDLKAKQEEEIRLNKMLDKHIEFFKKWLAEEGIRADSNLGVELTKQTRLLFLLERKLGN